MQHCVCGFGIADRIMHDRSVIDRGHITASPSTRNHTNTSIELALSGAESADSQHPPAAENASSANSGCASSMDRFKIHNIFPVALQQQFERITSAAFVLVPEPDRIKTGDPYVISPPRAIPSTRSIALRPQCNRCTAAERWLVQ